MSKAQEYVSTRLIAKSLEAMSRFPYYAGVSEGAIENWITLSARSRLNGTCIHRMRLSLENASGENVQEMNISVVTQVAAGEAGGISVAHSARLRVKEKKPGSPR